MVIKADIYNIVKPRGNPKKLNNGELIPRTEGLYGLEIEAEGNFLPTRLDPRLWNVEKDGSLQAGLEAWEYVMPAPTSLEGVKKALDYLEKQYVMNSSQVLDSDTSGVHVHMNVQDYTARELFTLLTTYLTLEELLITYCGPSREGNHFCLRIKDAEFLLHELVKTAKSHNFGNLNRDILRYSSVNTCSLFLYGSIEFRAMRGTRDLNAIYGWVEILDRVGWLLNSSPILVKLFSP